MVRFNYVRDQRRSWVDPQMRRGIAVFRRAVQLIFAIAQAVDFHLAAVKFSLADNAKTLVVERSPFPQSILSTQSREPIVEFEMGDHDAESSLLTASRRTIGAADDCMIGQNPTTSHLSNDALFVDLGSHSRLERCTVGPAQGSGPQEFEGQLKKRA
ncbi:MAG TPA: hypothetical protein VNE84_03010 [Candidatus Limnocylindria bacterium]|nr:hypothetical protein [Candidatus Limnocylindria bacterium]